MSRESLARMAPHAPLRRAGHTKWVELPRPKTPAPWSSGQSLFSYTTITDRLLCQTCCLPYQKRITLDANSARLQTALPHASTATSALSKDTQAVHSASNTQHSMLTTVAATSALTDMPTQPSSAHCAWPSDLLGCIGSHLFQCKAKHHALPSGACSDGTLWLQTHCLCVHATPLLYSANTCAWAPVKLKYRSHFYRWGNTSLLVNAMPLPSVQVPRAVK